jgi:small subunit ribosomal protein S6
LPIVPSTKSRTYEAVYIFDSALEDPQIAEKLDRHHGLLSASGDISLEHWGRRQLAYPIKKRENGYYIIAQFTLDDVSVLPEFERALKLDEGVLRYLISLHERELGAPPMTEEELAARKKDDDDDEDEE